MCSALCALQITHSLITGAGLAALVALPLTALDVSGSQLLTDGDLEALAPLPLRSLSISSCVRLTGGCLHHLTAWALRSLDVSWLGIEPASMGALCAMPLRELYMAHCGAANSAGLAHIAGLYHLRVLDLSSNSSLDDDALSSLSNLFTLQCLYLDRCVNITDDGMFHIGALPLTELSLDSCPIGDDGLAFLADLPLKSLSLELSSVSDAGLDLLACPLQRLSTRNCVWTLRPRGLEEPEPKANWVRNLEAHWNEYLESECK